MPIHYCPVCGAPHEVHPILHALAYGNQLTCSPRCKTGFPRVVWSRLLASAANDAALANEHDRNKAITCDAELQEMQQELNLHELTVEDARYGHQQPKISEYVDSTFAVMHRPELDDKLPIPADLVTSSVSGLDPHIGLAAETTTGTCIKLTKIGQYGLVPDSKEHTRAASHYP